MTNRGAFSGGQAAILARKGALPDAAAVFGMIDLAAASGPAPEALPACLQAEAIDLNGQSSIRELPSGWRVYDANLAGTSIETIPDDWQIESRLDLTGCDRLERLPDGLTLGTLILRGCTALTALPERLDTWFLDLSGCWALQNWPKQAKLRGGRLRLRGCSALRELPDYLGTLSGVDIRDCPNLTRLPDNLRISGWLDIGHSGITHESQLPASLARVTLRWGGVDIDRRIAFQPESISVSEVLQESNAERRRVLLDRVGYGRFLLEARAEKLDGDRDPGGPRELLRVVMQGDEDLVAMSCFCPSTGRQYFLRVPPATRTCRQAAAWIAGFDNPDEYTPIIET